MKKIIFIVIAIILGLSSCHDDDYITGVPSFGPPEVNNMADRVNGRVALGYVTYYGKVLPDPTYMTHINYAFAELYIKNNVYQKFDLQGDKERFNQVKKLKERNSNLCESWKNKSRFVYADYFGMLFSIWIFYNNSSLYWR